jgi:chemotaxis signal transduction protein
MRSDLLASSVERKAAIVRQAPATDGASGLSLMLLRLGTSWFAIDVHAVAEVAPRGTVTRVPTAPAHIQGIISVRGRLVTVISMQQLLGSEALWSGERPATLPRLVVVRHGDYEIALVAESIHGIGQHADPVPADAEPSKSLPEFVRREFSWQGNRVALLDAPKLVATAARLSGVHSNLDMVEA